MPTSGSIGSTGNWDSSGRGATAFIAPIPSESR
jgi:hypothetical protein